MLPRRPQRGRAATKRNRNISRKDAKALSKKPKTFENLASWREEYPNPKFPTLAKFAQAAKNLNDSSMKVMIKNIRTLRVLRVLRGDKTNGMARLRQPPN